MLHVDLPSLKEISNLSELRSDACVSIYIETTPLREELNASRIQFSNAIKEAIAQLEAINLDKRRRQALEERLQLLVEDDAFWRLHATTLAVFSTPDKTFLFRLPNQLNHRVEVADRFYLKPLLRSLTFSHATDIITISEHAVRFIELFEDGRSVEVDIKHMPKNLQEIANAEDGSNLRGADNIKVRYQQYVSRILAAIRPHFLHNNHPLVLVAAEPLASVFKNACTLPNLLEDIVFKNADHTTVSDIINDVRPVLHQHHKKLLAEAHELVHLRQSQNRVCVDLSEAARLATFGAIDTLLVNLDAFVPGIVNDQGVIERVEQDNALVFDIIDELAKRAIATGAKILAVRQDGLPLGAKEIVAVTRYPI